MCIRADTAEGCYFVFRVAFHLRNERPVIMSVQGEVTGNFCTDGLLNYGEQSTAYRRFDGVECALLIDRRWTRSWNNELNSWGWAFTSLTAFQIVRCRKLTFCTKVPVWGLGDSRWTNTGRFIFSQVMSRRYMLIIQAKLWPQIQIWHCKRNQILVGSNSCQMRQLAFVKSYRALKCNMCSKLQMSKKFVPNR